LSDLFDMGVDEYGNELEPKKEPQSMKFMDLTQSKLALHTVAPLTTVKPESKSDKLPVSSRENTQHNPVVTPLPDGRYRFV
jgi:hypothetical protein